MTVAELIKKLQELPQDYYIINRVYDPDLGDMAANYPIQSVYYDEEDDICCIEGYA